MSESKVISVPQEFRQKEWAKDIMDAIRENHNWVQDMMDIDLQFEDDTGMQVLPNARSNRQYLPTMRNYLKICNFYDLDARKYIKLEGE